jgi:hypothetical protein
MKPNQISMIPRLISDILLLLFLTNCSADFPTATTPSPISASSTEDPKGLSTEAILTLRSLEKLHDNPFYVMHYAGGYEYPRIGSS